MEFVGTEGHRSRTLRWVRVRIRPSPSPPIRQSEEGGREVAGGDGVTPVGVVDGGIWRGIERGVELEWISGQEGEVALAVEWRS